MTVDFNIIKKALNYAAKNSGFYRKLFQGIDIGKIDNLKDFESLPFSDKHDLRAAYPLGIQAVPDDKVVRIHASSGTTGKSVIIPYTKKDVEDWSLMFARCYKMAGINATDRVQITPGYGLWTAGIGFQAGCERLGAMAIPTGPGNTDRQLEMMVDLKSTVLCATSSYALLLAEEVNRRGIKDRIHLKRGIIGSERWGDLMRSRIASILNIELFDIYGLTEIYGPGIAIDCPCHKGMHYWNDYFYFEIIDPDTGKVLPKGEYGELVITTLKKEGAPLIRYRTHDLTRIIPDPCPCGSIFPTIDRIIGRTDDMIKIKGVSFYPSQIESLLSEIKGISSEYQIIISCQEGKEVLTLKVEATDICARDQIVSSVCNAFKTNIGIKIDCECFELGSLPRSEKKSKRVYDYRQC
ncbi:MAG: phenylacetate--CoA ligase [Clostridiales bacterium]|nr:phenylacetate--CoA ligase [Clostridiales bacterium]